MNSTIIEQQMSVINKQAELIAEYQKLLSLLTGNKQDIKIRPGE